MTPGGRYRTSVCYATPARHWAMGFIRPFLGLTPTGQRYRAVKNAFLAFFRTGLI
jgi:hypothetical protein